MKLWRIVLACFLILFALLAITNIKFESQNLLVGLLALASGVLLAFDK